MLEIIYRGAVLFLIYAFGGWCGEVLYNAAVRGKIINCGMLNGPVCPIYGFGGLAVTYLTSQVPSGVQVPVWMVFLFVAAAGDLIELAGGMILEKAFHVKWWDYSHKPFNFRGYICLEFTVIWGFAAVLLIEVIQPLLSAVSFTRHSSTLGWVFLIIAYTGLLTDLYVTNRSAHALDQDLEHLDQIRKRLRSISDPMSQRLGRQALETTQRVQESRVQAELARAEFRDQRELEQKYAELRQKLYGGKGHGESRLVRVFPDMKHRHYGSLKDREKEER